VNDGRQEFAEVAVVRREVPRGPCGEVRREVLSVSAGPSHFRIAPIKIDNLGKPLTSNAVGEIHFSNVVHGWR
jgi:hypothetical protein